MGEYIFLIVILLFMVGMMFMQTRKSKQQQQERKTFWDTVQPGTLVQTIGGVIGNVVEVDQEYEEVVIDSEGSRLRFSFRAVRGEYVRPAYVHDDEVDEEGNPIASAPEQIEDQPQVEEPEVVETQTVVEEEVDNNNTQR